MLLSDVVNVIGNKPLTAFPWGCVVRDTVNLFVSREYVLTMESTGDDVHAALDSLGGEVRALVLRSNVDMSRCAIQVPVGGGMVVEHEDIQSLPTTSSEEEHFMDLRKVLASPLFLISASGILAILTAALVLVSTLSGNEGTDWDGILKHVAALIKLFTS